MLLFNTHLLISFIACRNYWKCCCLSVYRFFSQQKSNALATINPQGKSFPKIICVIYQFHMDIYKQSNWHQINGSVHVYFKHSYWSLPIFSVKMNVYSQDTSTILSWLPWRYGPVIECLLVHAGFTVRWSLPTYTPLHSSPAKHWQEISPPGALNRGNNNKFPNLYRAIFVWPGNENVWKKQKQQTNGNRAIWLVCWMDTNASGFWLVKQTLGSKNFMLKKLSRKLSINTLLWRHTATRLANQTCNAFPC